jgi:hypothetical protein
MSIELTSKYFTLLVLLDFLERFQIFEKFFYIRW